MNVLLVSTTPLIVVGEYPMVTITACSPAYKGLAVLSSLQAPPTGNANCSPAVYLGWLLFSYMLIKKQIILKIYIIALINQQREVS